MQFRPHDPVKLSNECGDGDARAPARALLSVGVLHSRSSEARTESLNSPTPQVVGQTPVDAALRRSVLVPPRSPATSCETSDGQPVFHGGIRIAFVGERPNGVIPQHPHTRNQVVSPAGPFVHGIAWSGGRRTPSAPGNIYPLLPQLEKSIRLESGKSPPGRFLCPKPQATVFLAYNAHPLRLRHEQLDVLHRRLKRIRPRRRRIEAFDQLGPVFRTRRRAESDMQVHPAGEPDAKQQQRQQHDAPSAPPASRRAR